MRFLLLFALIVLAPRIGFSQDYIQYHKSIIKAEEQMFVHNKVSDGLKMYEQVFSKYDFVFVHDCVTAMQMALYANDEQSFVKFTDKATKNGLRKHVLEKFSYIAKHPLYLKNKDSIEILCKKNRAYYIRRLDTASLVKIYALYAIDQTQKNDRQNERRIEYELRYYKQIKETMYQLRKLATDRGFPGDKLIGIKQANIMAELKNGKPDLLSYYYDYKEESNIHKSQLEVEEHHLSSIDLLVPILIHYAHAWKDFQFFDNQYYIEQIKKGNLHPKDFAFINDIRFDVSFDGEHFRKPNFVGGDMYFRTGERPDETGRESPTNADAEINKFRAKYFIAPIEQDRAKRKFMKEHKMYYGWGWHGNRS